MKRAIELGYLQSKRGKIVGDEPPRNEEVVDARKDVLHEVRAFAAGGGEKRVKPSERDEQYGRMLTRGTERSVKLRLTSSSHSGRVNLI